MLASPSHRQGQPSVGHGIYLARSIPHFLTHLAGVRLSGPGYLYLRLPETGRPFLETPALSCVNRQILRKGFQYFPDEP